MADFTVNKYTLLLKALIEQDYQFQTFHEYLTNPMPRSVILRHDVDKRPKNSLTLAKIESEFGLKGVYNFRVKPCSWDEEIIKEISKLGHEIGYHYEELSTYRGDFNKTIENFKLNLEKLRNLVPVSTICMHGSPRSKHDSRDLWKHFSYRDFELIGEPYFDIDFSKVLYLTDTGRRWDGEKVSIRDRVNPEQKLILSQNGYFFKTTKDILRAGKDHALPDHIMFTIHPQRWHGKMHLWIGEYVSQNLKNVIKRFLNLRKK